jgi:hypothetical protein
MAEQDDRQPLPGHRILTNMPTLPNNGARSSGFNTTRIVPKCMVYNDTVAAGIENAFHCDFDVEWWIVAVIAAAGVRAQVVAASSAAGPGWQFGGGGHANIPAQNTPDLAYKNIGANPLTIVAVAIVGYPITLDYDPGDLA